MKKIIKNELQNWKAIEVIWIIIACSIILSLSIYWKNLEQPNNYLIYSEKLLLFKTKVNPL